MATVKPARPALVYKKIRYDENQRNRIDEVFQVKLRNSLSHNNFRVDGTYLTYYDKKGISTKLEYFELMIPIMKITVIAHIVNKKLDELLLKK